MKTAEEVARPHNLEVQICEPIGEVHMGEWSGLTYRQLDESPEWKRFNTARSLTRIPGGELMIETQMRVVIELHGLCRKHASENFVAVSHGDVIKAAIAYFAGIPLDFLARFDIAPASISVIAFDQEFPHILRLNDTGDLHNQSFWHWRQP